MDVQPVRLEGPTIRLEPLVPGHASLLWPKLETELFRHTLEWPRDPSLEAFEDWVRAGLEMPGSSLYAIFVQATGEVAGMTGYLEIRPRHRGLEIGRTLIARAHQGTCVNPESKYLLLRHAFEDLEAVRVQLKTDVTNLHSQRAIEKLGAKREGVLRRYQVRTNGFARDTVVYSIVAEEWPEVKAGLEGRMAGGGRMSELRIRTVSFSEVDMNVQFSDGREIVVPLSHFSRLKSATKADQNQWSLIGRGIGIHWDSLDEDLSVENILTAYGRGER